MKTVSQLLEHSQHRLDQAGIGTGRLDALILLEDVLGKDRSWILANPSFHIDDESFHTLEKLITRREKHEPLAYIREKTEFYGREFYINQNVLEPRPESETMIEQLKGLGHRGKGLVVIDVGTGSGALAITAKLEIPEAAVVAIDIDKKCLEVAKENAQRHKTDITFNQGDLLKSYPPSPKPHTLVVLANLPYVPNDYTLNQAAENEPRLAIFGGPDGLDLYRELFMQLARLNDQVTVLTESLPFQHETLAHIARSQNFAQIAKQDFIQVFEKKSEFLFKGL